MGLGIYKKGQGYWTRVMSAISLGLLVVMGGLWLWDNLKNASIGGREPIYTQAVSFILFASFFSLLGYYLIGKRAKTVDFLVATEGEMKKVNWSSRREIRGSTIVVIGLTAMIAAIIYVLDFWVWARLFQWINVLDPAAGG